MKRMTVVMPDELAAALEQERRRQDTSASAVVRAALEAMLVEPRQEALAGMVGLFDAPDNDLADRFEELLDTDWAEWIWEDSGLSNSVDERMHALPATDEPSLVSEADASSP